MIQLSVLTRNFPYLLVAMYGVFNSLCEARIPMPLSQLPMAFGSMIRLHVLDIDGPLATMREADAENIFTKWFLDMDMKKDMGSNNNMDTDSLAIEIEAGDMIVFPQLKSGAGEFECLRYADHPKLDFDGQKKLIPLLLSDIESAAFPKEIVTMAQEESCAYTLRQVYESPLEYMLDKYEGFTLEDIYGGKEVVEEFWCNPDITSDVQQEDDNGTFVIQLSQCRLLETKEFHIS